MTAKHATTRIVLIAIATTLITLCCAAEYQYYQLSIRQYTTWQQFLYAHMHNNIPW